ncbi:MAG: NRDE family protein [bacterium]
MCTLVAYVGWSPALPLVVAANRDEFLDRPASEPAVIALAPWVLAGQDLSAGGTWFGLNAHGMVVGLLNRRRPEGPDPTRRSRGLLCLEVLQSASLAAATALLNAVPPLDYNPFNLLVADAGGARVVASDGRALRITTLPRGVHLLTNLDLNDPTCPRIAKSSSRFATLQLPPDGDASALVGPLSAILADHTTALDPRATIIDTLCVHRQGYGTRSASIVAISASSAPRYWHAAGPPCRTAFHELALPEKTAGIVPGQGLSD